jgi:hypothetical protein
MLRFLVYLCDLNETTGPLNYVPAGKNALAHERLRYRSGLMCDNAFAQALSPSHQQAITGPFGTMIVFDGTRIFHRAHPPTSRDRLSLSITYCSRHPRQILRAVRLSRASRRRLLAMIGDRERACIPAARWI